MNESRVDADDVDDATLVLLADDAESRVSVPEDDDNASCDEALGGSGGLSMLF